MIPEDILKKGVCENDCLLSLTAEQLSVILEMLENSYDLGMEHGEGMENIVFADENSY
jgi:hypothetical protein